VKNISASGESNLKDLKYGNIYFFRIHILISTLSRLDFEIRLDKDTTFNINKCKDIKILAHNFGKNYKDETIRNFSNYTNIPLKCSSVKYKVKQFYSYVDVEYKSIVAKIKSKIKWKTGDYIGIKLITNFEEDSIDIYMNQVHIEEDNIDAKMNILIKVMIILGVLNVLLCTIARCIRYNKKSENNAAEENNISNDSNNHEENILPEEQ
jgi:hypothetical protein